MHVKKYALLNIEYFEGRTMKYIAAVGTESDVLARCVQWAAEHPEQDYFILKREKIVKRTKYERTVKYSIVRKYNHRNGYGLQEDILYRGGGYALIKQTGGIYTWSGICTVEEVNG